MRMLPLKLALALTAPVIAFPITESSEINSQCSQIQIPVTVFEPRSILNITIEDDWDAASLTFNLTSRNFGTSDNPLPIAGEMDFAAESNYTVGATLCGTGSTLLVTTHGIIESKSFVFNIFYQVTLWTLLIMMKILSAKSSQLVSIQFCECCCGGRI